MSVDLNFTGRTVMITGAAGHLGRALAAAFAEQGARLALFAHRREELQRLFGDEDARRLHIAADLLDEQALGAGVGAALGRFERIDVLCNIAGAFRMGKPVHETPDSDWDFLFDINARTVRNTARAVVPHMLAAGGGKIVNVGAYAALHGEANKSVYGAAKASVIHLTEAMAAELRERNINVNCVLPTTIDTPDNRAAMPKADPARWVAPQDLASVIMFLASDAARAVHGAALPVVGLS